MRPQRAYGRPGTAVFPTGWDASHAVVLDATLTGTVAIGPTSSTPTWNPVTHQTETVPAVPVYTGPASISPASPSGDAARLSVVDQQVEQGKYSITLPHHTTGITDEHRVNVTDCPGDPDLVGRWLNIDGIALGSLRFARHLSCTLID